MGNRSVMCNDFFKGPATLNERLNLSMMQEKKTHIFRQLIKAGGVLIKTSKNAY